MSTVEERGPVKLDPNSIVQLLSEYRQVHIKTTLFGVTLFRKENNICIAHHKSIDCLDEKHAVQRLKELLGSITQAKLVLFK